MGEFSKRLKKLRIDKSLTQDELAPELGVSRSTLGMYETGKREPDFETLETIADFFNVDMNYLIGYSDDPHDWEKIGNEAGIHPSKDYEGSYEDYVKFKIYEEQDALIDSYYDSHPEECINEPCREEFLTKNNSYENFVVLEMKKMNKKGKIKLLDTAREMNCNPLYNKNYMAEVNAAHERTDINIPEDADTSENDIMDDEDF